MTILDAKSNVVAAVCQQIHSLFPQEYENISLFTHHFFKRVPLEFLQKIPLSQWIRIVQETWELFQIRQPHLSLVKLKKYELSHHTMPRLGIFMVNVDQPFLIDSIIAFLDKKGFKIELIVHPVLGVQRTRDGKLVSLVDLKEVHPPSVLQASLDPASKIMADGKNTLSNQPESIAFIQIKANLKKKQTAYLLKEINELITQVRNVVYDWPLMKNQIKLVQHLVTKLPLTKSFPALPERDDLKNFLTWLEHGRFVFLGTRYLRTNPKEQASKNLAGKHSFSPLGLFRDATFSGKEDIVPIFHRPRLMNDQQEMASSKRSILSVTKTNTRSIVHRPSRIESIEIIDMDPKGNPQGLYQFIGLFTKAAFTGSAFDPPIIGRKVQNVFNQFGLAPQWHDGKTLINIINSIPRDELFYLEESQIYDISQNVLNMSDQHSLTLSIRPDIYGRYITVMIFLAKEKYSVALKGRIAELLEQYLQGKISSDNVLLGDLDYARLIFVIEFPHPRLVSYNQVDIEKALLEASLSWEDYLERLIGNLYDEEDTAALLARYQKAFPTPYIDVFTPEQAVTDISYIENITDTQPVDLYLYKNKQNKTLKVKIFHAHHPLSLSTLLPILQNLGLQVIGETTYSLEREGYPVWIHDFDVDPQGIENWKTNHHHLLDAFHHIWKGAVENDVLHQLTLKVGLTVRQVTLMRAYLKYLRQVQLPYSWGYLVETLSHYPDLTRHFVELFELQFSLKRSKANELEKSHLLKDIYYHLEKIDRLDHDRILRRLLNAIRATVRTNYFQAKEKEDLKPYLSFKFDCRKLDDLPHPRPLYEIFVYSSRVEAIHLRGAKVARGGIRWSDRPEDFRTEVLGLMKAQNVKNSVIVPLGSKGGFVVKHQDKFTTPSQLKEEVVSCYEIMIRGMLDITDNLVKGKVVHPPQVIRLDEDDPYLVVAADKGTAEFSDIANAISNEYGFWLDDAFASGGSVGYDHKKMGITARGVWESVKRHFRELKHDCQTLPFTVVGVGDMGGDVFGNGMLQSSQIRLLGAFNHKHIFLDPEPDPQSSFKERKRLFDMPQSSWKDYNLKLISAGGGVFERSAKSVKITPQIRKAFGISQSEMTPDDLIKHLLCLPVDLLYFGGIGTFIKAATENHSDVGDRANNDIRVDAKAIQAKIIGEGANLAMTQRARIEFSLKGGRLNTDAIDNSAGVDCSDHEVNLKILFKTLGNSISRNDRNDLLKKMTDDVAQLVLADNYRQNQTLTFLETTSLSDMNAYQSLMRILETEVGLDRFLEALPDDETLEQRRIRNQGLTRPELSILLAYSKIALYEKILSSPLPDNPSYLPWFHGYFPEIIQKRFPKAMNAHPLRREIIATVLTNEVMNRVGPAFIHDISQTCGVSVLNVVKAFFLACHVLELKKLWTQIDSLDSLNEVSVQTHVLLDLNQALEQVILWFLRYPDIKQENFAGLHTLLTQVPDKLYGDQQHNFNVRYQGFLHIGIPKDIAHSLSLIPFLPALLDIMVLGKKRHNPLAIAHTYFALRSKIGLDWLAIQAAQIHADTEWQRSARTILIDDLAQLQVKLTNRVITETEDNNIDVWVQKYKDQLHPTLSTMKSAGHPDLGMLSYAMRQLERLI